MNSSLEFEPLFTSTVRSSDRLDEILFSVRNMIEEPATLDCNTVNLDSSVQFIKKVEIITLDYSQTASNNGTITIEDDTVESTHQQDESSNSMEVTKESNGSFQNSYESNNSSKDSSGSFIATCPVHNHHKDNADNSICPADLPCNCI